jgi:hypothetical protein
LSLNTPAGLVSADTGLKFVFSLDSGTLPAYKRLIGEWKYQSLICVWTETAMPERLLVFLGDVEDSRGIERRDEFQRVLEETCIRLNETHSGALRSGFAILKGIDEIGAVLLSVSPVYRMVDEIGRALHPQRMRFAVAMGVVDTGLESPDVGKMDGPAFHRAAAIMAELKKNKLPFGMEVEDPLLDEALAGVASLIQMAKARRSERQWEAVAAYERLGTQAQAASELEVTQQAISHALVSADYKQVKLVEDRLNRAFEEYAARLNARKQRPAGREGRDA